MAVITQFSIPHRLMKTLLILHITTFNCVVLFCHPFALSNFITLQQFLNLTLIISYLHLINSNPSFFDPKIF